VGDGGIKYTGSEGHFGITAPDVALVSLGAASPFPTPLAPPDMTLGAHFSMSSNIWNTNCKCIRVYVVPNVTVHNQVSAIYLSGALLATEARASCCDRSVVVSICPRRRRPTFSLHNLNLIIARMKGVENSVGPTSIIAPAGRQFCEAKLTLLLAQPFCHPATFPMRVATRNHIS
jgi:hypothetical protein